MEKQHCYLTSAFFGLGFAVGCGSYEAANDTAMDAMNAVYISPERPSSRQDLVCRVLDEEGPFDFYWTRNSDEYSSTGSKSVFPKEMTAPGDYITCTVWTPASAWSDGFELGSYSVFAH